MKTVNQNRIFFIPARLRHTTSHRRVCPTSDLKILIFHNVIALLPGATGVIRYYPEELKVVTYDGYWGLSTLNNTLGLTEFYSTIDSKNGLMRKTMSLATWNTRLDIEEYMPA